MTTNERGCCEKCFIPERDGTIFYSHAAGYALPEACRNDIDDGEEPCPCHNERGWEEAFDELQKSHGTGRYSELRPKLVKDFIRQTLDTALSNERAAIVEGLEGMRREIPLSRDHGHFNNEGFNEGLDDAISLIHSRDEKSNEKI